MGQLSASIAHEVNQPIGAAITYANAALNWLRPQPPNLEEVRRALGLIMEAGIRAGDVVDRIRALVKKAPLRNDRVDINEAVVQIVELTRGEMAKNTISIRMQLAENVPAIRGDRVQLQQVILNLLINAIEAMRGMREGARELLISTLETESEGVLVAVRDSGPGLDPASIHRCSSPSTPPNLAAWEWGCRSAVRLSKLIRDDCGPARTLHTVPSFNSRCHHIHMVRTRIVEDVCSIHTAANVSWRVFVDAAVHQRRDLGVGVDLDEAGSPRIAPRIHNPSPFVQNHGSLGLSRQTIAHGPANFVG